MPTKRSVDDIKSKLLRPALTSHFEVQIPIPPGLQGTAGAKYLEANGLFQFVGVKQEDLQLYCSETVLPGSNLGTMDITGDYHGVTQRHANRRIYDDRIDLTFYVDALNYLPIRYFETWIKYCVGEGITGTGTRPGSMSPEYFYRLNYPNLYIATGLKVIKFERDYKSFLEYEFINAFPISVASMPISYDSSSLLKCTVSFSYIRYVLKPTGTDKSEHADAFTNESTTTGGDPSSPATQAAFNNAQFESSNTTLPALQGTGALSTTIGGVPQSAANSSGNTVSGFTVGANAGVA